MRTSYEHDWNGFGKVSRPPFRKYIHYGGYLWLIFVNMKKRKFSETLNTLKMAEISRSKWSSKKVFLKTPRRYFLWSVAPGSLPASLFWQSNLLHMIRAFDRYKLENHTTSENVSTAGNSKICDFTKMLREHFKIALKSNWPGNEDFYIKLRFLDFKHL